MLGLFIGTLCLIALVATMHRHRHGAFAYGYGYGPIFHRFDPYRPRGRARYLYGLFRRLDTTPGQEKAIVGVMNGLFDRLGASRGELVAARKDLAAALAGDELDVAAFDEVFLRGNEWFAKLSHELQSALIQVHETLAPEQRKQLAELLADGSFDLHFHRHVRAC